MKKAALLVLTCALIYLPPASSQEQHSHPAPEELGAVTFPTSCAHNVQARFERAVALLHSFAYTSAEQAFQSVADAEPRCAMAHWGIAMTYFHQLWDPPQAETLHQGLTQIDTARRLGAASARERQFIDAAGAYYRDSDRLPHPVRAKAYERAMAEVAKANPQDPEAQIFYALALISTAPPQDRTHNNQKRAADILEPLYRKLPRHPGLAHYLIHAYDSTELAPRGLAAARAYSKIAPSAPHALHMPSHIFTRLGYWDDSIAANMAARSAAHVQGDVGEELHAMDYLTYAFLQRGREADAERVVADLRTMTGLPVGEFKAGYAATAMPVRLAVERHQWSAAAALQPLPQSAPHVAAIVYWARAISRIRSGHPQDADGDFASLTTCLHQLQASGSSYWATQVEILQKQAEAWRLLAKRKPAEATQRMRSAADEEDAIEKLPVTPGPIIPAREQLGEMLLELDQPRDALREFQAALVASPGRRGALTGVARAAELARR